jgi:hypothetical protein
MSTLDDNTWLTNEELYQFLRISHNSDGSLTESAVGATGATGATGPAGPAGASGAAGQYGEDAVLPGGWTHTEHGFLMWNYDIANASGASAPTAGVGLVQRFNIPETGNLVVSNAHLWVTNTPSGGSDAFVCLFNSDGTRKGTPSADQTTFGGAAGLKTIALGGAPLTLVAGEFYWLMLLVGTAGGTPAQFARRAAASSGAISAGLTAATARVGSYGSSQTTIPASITPSSISLSVSVETWGALS